MPRSAVPAGEEPPIHFELDVGQIERICQTALAEPDRHSAARFLTSVLAQIGESPIPGLRNEGLFATHELSRGVPANASWLDAGAKAQPLLNQRGRSGNANTIRELPW